MRQPADRLQWHWWQSRRTGKIVDLIFDVMLNRPRTLAKIREASRECKPQNILIVGVVVKGREADMYNVSKLLSSSLHYCTYKFVDMKPQGKFDNVNDALAEIGDDVGNFDWLIVTDDDIAASPDFLNRFIGLAVEAGLDMAQPAHRMFSHTSWKITKRVWGSLVRKTKYVEIGPLTAINARVFDQTLPFPSMRWAWGLDVYWADLAMKNAWSFGVVDGTPIEHLRPVGGIYAREEAEKEADLFLTSQNINLTRNEIMSGAILRHW